jgi:Z1 domain
MSIETADPELVTLADGLATSIAGGDSPERAALRLIGYGIPEERVQQALRLHEERVGRIREATDPRVVQAEELRTGGWYGGPQPGDVFWPALSGRVSLSDEALESVDLRSDRIMSLLSKPGADEIRTRGLVLGYVQSGKTTSFMSVIAKAADRGYRMFVVLSGITDSLRSQTQARLDEILVGEERQRWHWLTEPDHDFAYSPLNAANLLRDNSSRAIAVVKKNPYRLRRLAAFLDGAGDTILKSCPILLIDDEADQATIDVGKRGRVSRINSLIRRILAKPKVGYVAYTATPFANLLVNPLEYEGLYPRHFIVDLGRPKGYFGAEKIFGRDLLDVTDEVADDPMDVVRLVPDADVTGVRPSSRNAVHTWQATVPDSLAEALRWFLLATAARRVRDGRSDHSTMLIHTSMLTAAHQGMRECVGRYLANVARDINADDPATFASFEQQWHDETARVPAAAENLPDVPWADVRSRLVDVVADLRVFVDNHLSTERLTYPKGEPRTAVVIGGNTLSRGLTLEGLVCSYFVRSATAYDTLLQMGRWFGYRAGYSDLVRIWMTAELAGWFFDLATVEAEIRQQVLRYEDERLTPEELSVKIRRHPAMIITSAAKMRDGVAAQVSYGGDREQTILFNHKDEDWLRHNIDATGRLLKKAREAGSVPEDGSLGGLVLRDVPADVVTAFLNDYQFHPNARRLKRELLTGYIALQNQHKALLTWSVAVITDGAGVKGTIELDGQEVNLSQRSRLAISDPAYANIKSLVSRIDRAADLRESREDIRRMAGDDTDDAYARLRDDLLGPVGLLCIYPIARDSKPAEHPRYKDRRPLDAAAHVIGVGLFFPEDRSNKPYEYVSVGLSGLAIESDEPDVDQLDELDQKAGEAQESETDPRRTRGGQ